MPITSTISFRILAIFSAGLGAFFAVVSATAYRKGEAWAWYLTWVVPVLFLLDVSNDYLAFGYVDVGSMVIAAILVAGLLLPYRKFFPIKPTPELFIVGNRQSRR